MSQTGTSFLHSTHMNDPNGRAVGIPLPMELILEVVSHLDSYSIMDLLRAWPALKVNTILITDHPLQPLFFDVEGVERRFIKEGTSIIRDREWEWFDPTVHRQSIQLIELSFFLVEDHQDIKFYGKLKNDDPTVRKPDWIHPQGWYLKGESMKYAPNLGKTSFVFLRESFNHGLTQTRRLREIELEIEQTSCHWHTGSNTNFSVEAAMSLIFDLEENYSTETISKLLHELASRSRSRGYQVRGNILDHMSPALNLAELKTLHIVTTSPLRDISLPSVVELSIVLRQESSTKHKRGEINGLNIPSVHHLIIHYDTIAPQLRNIQVRYCIFTSHCEIANIRALQGGDTLSACKDSLNIRPSSAEDLHSLVPSSYEYTDNSELEFISLFDIFDAPAGRTDHLRDVDMEFMHRFEDVSFIGTPTWMVAYWMDLLVERRWSSTDRFRWQISGPDPYAADMSVFPMRGLHLNQQLREVSIQVCLPDVKIPRFSTYSLSRVNITFFCPGGELSAFWGGMSTFGDGYRYACIYSPHIPKDLPGYTYLGLTKREWRKMRRIFKVIQLA